nr:hypothetical protein [Tanacetum cinerariifolium]
ISFDDLYNKLKFLKIDTKGYSSSSSTPSNAAFVSTAGSSQGNLSYQELGNGGYTITLSVSPGSSSSKGSSKSKYSGMSTQGGQNSNNYQNYKSKEAGKDGSDSKAMVVVDGSIDSDKQTEEGNTEPRSLENFGMIAVIKIESDADSEGEVVSANDAIPAGNVAVAVV